MSNTLLYQYFMLYKHDIPGFPAAKNPRTANSHTGNGKRIIHAPAQSPAHRSPQGFEEIIAGLAPWQHALFPLRCLPLRRCQSLPDEPCAPNRANPPPAGSPPAGDQTAGRFQEDVRTVLAAVAGTAQHKGEAIRQAKMPHGTHSLSFSAGGGDAQRHSLFMELPHQFPSAGLERNGGAVCFVQQTVSLLQHLIGCEIPAIDLDELLSPAPEIPGAPERLPRSGKGSPPSRRTS